MFQRRPAKLTVASAKPAGPKLGQSSSRNLLRKPQTRGCSGQRHRADILGMRGRGALGRLLRSTDVNIVFDARCVGPHIAGLESSSPEWSRISEMFDTGVFTLQSLANVKVSETLIDGASKTSVECDKRGFVYKTGNDE